MNKDGIWDYIWDEPARGCPGKPDRKDFVGKLDVCGIHDIKSPWCGQVAVQNYLAYLKKTGKPNLCGASLDPATNKFECGSVGGEKCGELNAIWYGNNPPGSD